MCQFCLDASIILGQSHCAHDHSVLETAAGVEQLNFGVLAARLPGLGSPHTYPASLRRGGDVSCGDGHGIAGRLSIAETLALDAKCRSGNIVFAALGCVGINPREDEFVLRQGVLRLAGWKRLRRVVVSRVKFC